MKTPVLIFLFSLTLGACSTVQLKYNYPEYLALKYQELPPELLLSRIVLDENKTTLFQTDPMTMGDFISYLMLAAPLDREVYISMDVVPGKEGSKLIILGNKRGDMVVKITMEFLYQDGYAFSRLEKVLWEDKLLGRTEELISLEDKAKFAVLVATLLSFQ